MHERPSSASVYRRSDPTSPVRLFQSGPGYIWVVFAHRGRRTAYRYTDASAGAAAVAHMQRLAAAGRGLASFIATRFARGAGHDRRIDL